MLRTEIVEAAGKRVMTWLMFLPTSSISLDNDFYTEKYEELKKDIMLDLDERYLELNEKILKRIEKMSVIVVG